MYVSLILGVAGPLGPLMAVAMLDGSIDLPSVNCSWLQKSKKDAATTDNRRTHEDDGVSSRLLDSDLFQNYGVVTLGDEESVRWLLGRKGIIDRRLDSFPLSNLVSFMPD